MKLSLEQIRAVEHIHGPALVLAVPGAGKTTVLIHRIANLICKHNVDPKRILSISFSKASARDMRDRFCNVFPNMSSLPIHFSTIHSFCYNLIRDYAHIKRIKFRLIEDENDEINKYNLLKKIYFDINKKYITEEKLESLLNSIGYVKNLMLTVEEFLTFNKAEVENFEQIFYTYEKYKRVNNLIDFDDMLTLSYEILVNNKLILDKYSRKYDFIQLDEGQDTSKIQMEIIKLLAKPKNNIFIVADDDQSIYSFRGAYPTGLLNFKKIYPSGKVFFMEKNYRSSKNIVSVSNKFIKNNRLRYNKTIYTDNDYVEPINIIKVNSINEQYNYLIEDLKGKDLSKTCILYRNNLSSIALMEVLARNKIPFSIRDLKLRFFNHWLISDILDFINFSRDNSNIGLYEKIYYKMKGYISKKHVAFAKTLNYSIPVFDRIMDYPGLSNYYKSTIRQLKLDFAKLSKMNACDAIEFIESDLEYEKYLKENSMKLGYTYDTLKTMLYFLKFIATNCDNLQDFMFRLNYLQYLSNNSSKNRNALTLSTIHSAKGLEFDRVYIIDLVDGDFPSISSVEAVEKGSFELFEEERRLFYVGMTRARYHLSLITVNYIGDRKVEASRFIEELVK